MDYTLSILMMNQMVSLEAHGGHGGYIILIGHGIFLVFILLYELYILFILYIYQNFEFYH